MISTVSYSDISAIFYENTDLLVINSQMNTMRSITKSITRNTKRFTITRRNITRRSITRRNIMRRGTTRR
jgi:hypothetical protein